MSTNIITGIFIEFILSFLLMFVIISVATDSRAQGEMAGLAIGITVCLCALVGGPLTGASMNPARSLGPGLIAKNFISLWPYLTVPFLGTTAGALTYQFIKCEIPGQNNGQGCC